MVPTQVLCPKCQKATLVGEKTDRGHVETCPFCGFDRGCVLIPVEQLRYLQDLLHSVYDNESDHSCSICDQGSNFEDLPHSFACRIDTALSYVEARLGEAYESTPTIQRLIPQQNASSSEHNES